MPRKPNAKLARVKNPDSRMVPLTLKVSIAEAHELEKKILYYASGNRSLFLRSAVLNYKPRKEDFK